MSTEPGAQAPTPASMSFAQYLEKMADPRAQDLTIVIKRFLRLFQQGSAASSALSRSGPSKLDPMLDSQRVQSFLEGMEPMYRAHPLFAGCSEEDIEAAMEGTEKYVMTKLYETLFRRYPSDRQRDDLLASRLRLLQFIEPVHLEIPEDKGYKRDLWLSAMRELAKMDEFKAPRDKLICLVNCCKIIMNSLAANAGADDFFPVLLYVVVKALPANLESNLQYIQRFRRSSRLAAESAYFLTHLLSAAHFLESADASKLNIDPETFARHTGQTQPTPTPSTPTTSTTSSLPQADAQSEDSTAATSSGGLFAGMAVLPAPSPPPKEASRTPALSPSPLPQAAGRAGSEPSGGLDSLPSAHDLLSAVEDRRPLPPMAALMRTAASSLLGPLNFKTAGTKVGAFVKDLTGPGSSSSRPAAFGTGTPMNQMGKGRGTGQPGPSPGSGSTAAKPGVVQVPAVKYPSLEALEAIGWPLVLEAEAEGSLNGRLRFLYTRPEDLTLRDVEGLLSAYKELALKHECLLRAVDALSMGTVALPAADSGGSNGTEPNSRAAD